MARLLMTPRTSNLLAAIFWALAAVAALCFVLGNNFLGTILLLGLGAWMFREIVIVGSDS